MNKRICSRCKKNKVNIFAWWFGLRVCEPCDIEIYVARMKELQ